MRFYHIRLILTMCATLALLPMAAFADFMPTAYYTIDGTDMESTDLINDAEAPLLVTFKANPSNLGDVVPTYEWRFTREGSAEPFITRYEEETSYEFREAGSFSVSLYVSDNDTTEGELIGTIRVSISSSILEMPNAFSPNGDGINDIYKAKNTHQSIIEFHAYIFNRWGQKLFEWTNIDDGWDGTYNGKQVADGVYFVLVKAKGADGTEYNIKRDVNVLRDYTEGGNQQ